MKKIIIAIDGFSSCGKSTMAKALAKRIGYIYVDTGAMYRAVTLYCVQNGWMEQLDNLTPELLSKINITFRLNSETGNADTYLNGVNVEKEIRSLDISNRVSIVSALPQVRHELVRIQQQLGVEKGLVMDGRDIGTTVFPQAELKIFLTASPEIRAQRRYDELKAKGQTASLDEIIANIKMRDELDQTRKESPLVKAEDAILLDNSHMTIEEQNRWLDEQFRRVACS